MNRKSCEGCVYYKPISMVNVATLGKGCHYLLDTGIKRPCPADKCTVKKRK